MPDVIFAGPAGRLEGRYAHARVANAPLAVILHPAPAQGGSMNTNMTRLMYQAFVARGFSVLRFNFRGVGRSEGEFDGGEGELSDAASALDWMQSINKAAPYVWVAGYSFGAWVGMQLLMRRPEVRGFISIAPPANLYDFTFLAPCPTSGLLLQGGEDKIVSPASVEHLANTLRRQKGIAIDHRVIPAANHFFHNCTEEVLFHIHDHMNAAQAGLTVPVSPQTQKKIAG